MEISKRIVMLVANPFTNDARVEKEAETLGRAGYHVYVFATARDDLSSHEIREYFQIYRIQVGRGAIGQILFKVRFLINSYLFPRGKSGEVRGLKTVLMDSTLGSESVPKRSKILKKYILSQYLALRYALSLSLRIVRFYFRSRVLLKNLAPDFIHCHDLDMGIMGMLYRAGGSKAEVVYDSHELWTERNRFGGKPPWWLKAVEIRMEKCLLRRAKMSITVCGAISEFLASRYSCVPPMVLRNLPIAIKWDQEGTSHGLLRSQLSLPENSVAIGYSGLATFNRGLEEVIRSLKNLPPYVHLVVLGYFDPTFKLVFDRLIKEMKVESRVHHFGPVPSREVPKYLSSLDIAVVPIVATNLSYKFCLPNKLFEAIQAGLPVIGSNLPEIRFTIDQWQCGRIFSDQSSLEREIGDLVENENLRQEMAKQSRLASQHLTWECEAPLLVNAYRKMTLAL